MEQQEVHTWPKRAVRSSDKRRLVTTDVLYSTDTRPNSEHVTVAAAAGVTKQRGRQQQQAASGKSAQVACLSTSLAHTYLSN